MQVASDHLRFYRELAGTLFLELPVARKLSRAAELTIQARRGVVWAMEWTDWGRLEVAIGLDELPAFHRAFLEHHRPGEADWEGAFLRQVQGKVQATLKQLQRDGRARLEGEILWVDKTAIPEAYRCYADT